MVDTGIPADAGAPVFFPPWMRPVQRVAQFRISPEEEIAAQIPTVYLPCHEWDAARRLAEREYIPAGSG